MTITTDDEYRYIVSNGIPDHEPGRFPNRGNPNAITTQEHRFRLPLHPTEADEPTPLGLSPFGVAINGVPFDPGTADFWNGDRESGWQYEALSGEIDLGLDAHNAHVQPGGAYHYHGAPAGVVGGEDDDRPTLIGYAADGFPVYAYAKFEHEPKPSYRVKAGSRPNGPGGAYDGTFVADYEYVEGSGDLDECNGRVGATPEYPEGTYHYFITNAFPFIPRLWRGDPDGSFLRRPHPGGPPGGRRPPITAVQPAEKLATTWGDVKRSSR